MPLRTRLQIVILVTLAFGGCSSSSSTWDLSQRAISAMGGAAAIQAIGSVAMADGAGTRNRLGQMPYEGGTDPQATLEGVATTIDYTGQRVAFEYDVALASGFSQHRIEVLTERDGQPVGYSINNNGRMASTPGGLFSWGPQNTPAMALGRDPIVILLDAARPGAGSVAAEAVDLAGNTRLYGTFTSSWGEEIGLYFDPESSLLVGFETLDTEPMMGDVEARYLLGDYQQVDDVLLPHRITIAKDGEPFSDVRYERIEVNRPGALTVFDIPADLDGQADRAVQEVHYAPLTWNEVANGVYHVVAYSHHSMVVEFPRFVAVVEAPYTETQSRAMAALIQQQIPDKPIRYAAITHPHWDHTGGVRGIASVGANVVVSSGHEIQMRPVLSAPHTNPPDALEQARDAGTAGTIEIFDNTWSISDGPQTLELYSISGSPHADPYVVAYVPASGVLFQSDLFTPGGAATASPAARHLLESIRDLNLRVQTLVGGHGGVGPFSELVDATSGG